MPKQRAQFRRSMSLVVDQTPMAPLSLWLRTETCEAR